MIKKPLKIQAGNPFGASAPHPDEVLQRPIPPTSRSEASENEAENNDEFHVRNRNSSRVNEFLELLSRISNRPSENQPENRPENQNNPGPSGTQQRPESSDDSSSENEDQNQGFLVIPSDPSTGSRPRLFSFVTRRSPIAAAQRQRYVRNLPKFAQNMAKICLKCGQFWSIFDHI